MMETETETNMKICMYKLILRFYWLCVQVVAIVILVNPFTSCFTDRYLPQQYITMQTIKRLAY